MIAVLKPVQRSIDWHLVSCAESQDGAVTSEFEANTSDNRMYHLVTLDSPNRDSGCYSVI